MRHLLLTLFLAVSCVSTTTTYDDFEGTWHSCQDTFGPFASDVELTIDETSVSIYVDNEHKGVKDYTTKDGQLIMGWAVDMHGSEIIFYDATMSIDEKMLLRWKPIDYYYSFTGIFKND